ncbi:MAG: hypothetical protein WCT99_06335, partial [Bacteroidota bacterium]
RFVHRFLNRAPPKFRLPTHIENQDSYFISYKKTTQNDLYARNDTFVLFCVFVCLWYNFYSPPLYG